MVKKIFTKLKMAHHRWCLKNAIAHYGMKISVYHASTNSYTVLSPFTGWKYHVYVDAEGQIQFKGIEYE